MNLVKRPLYHALAFRLTCITRKFVLLGLNESQNSYIKIVEYLVLVLFLSLKIITCFQQTSFHVVCKCQTKSLLLLRIPQFGIFHYILAKNC